MPVKAEMKFDKRILDRNLRAGIITKQEYQKHLDALKDLSDECATIESEITSIGHEIPLRGIGEEEEDL
jgi:hypothetical protein